MTTPGPTRAPEASQNLADINSCGAPATGAANPILKLEKVTIQFEDRGTLSTAVQEASLHVNPGEVLGIVGESGSGKTVTCMASMGLLQGWPGVVQGNIYFRHKDTESNLLSGLPSTLKTVDGIPVKNRRKWKFFVQKVFRPLWGDGMTMIFQDPQNALNPYWNVGKIVREAVRHKDPSLTRSQAMEMAVTWLSKVRLNDPKRVLKSYPHELSGGMAQRVMIASALARGTRVLFADEPTTGLDTTVKARIVELFSTLRHEENLAMVVISHDLGVVSALADRVVVMYKGRILETRPMGDIIRRAPDLHQYTKRLINAVDVWKHR